MSILVSGAAGFLGAALTERLIEDDRKVVAVDLFDSKSAWRLQSIINDPDLTYLWSSCQDISAKTLQKLEVETIIHLAAQPDVPLAIKSPVFTWKVNTENTLSLLEAARQSGGVPYIHMSSESSYGDSENIPIPETEQLQPTGVYGASKAAGDLLACAYGRGYKVPVTVIRSGTMYGPRSRTEQVIPIFLRKAFKGEKIPVEGGKQTRDFNYVENVVDAIILALDRYDWSGVDIFNIGSGEEQTILDVAKRCQDAAYTELRKHKIQMTGDHIELKPARPGEEKGVRLALDISKARKVLGYEPKVNFEKGLALTTAWVHGLVFPVE